MNYAGLLAMCVLLGGNGMQASAGAGRNSAPRGQAADLATPIPPSQIRFSVQSGSTDGPMDPLTGEAVFTLNDILTSRGAEHSRTPDWLFVVGSREIPDDPDHRIILTVTTLHALPSDAIEFGKKAEVFYLSMPPDKKATLPADGKWVREMVSEEMLRQYGAPVHQEILVTEREKAKRALLKVAEDFFTHSAVVHNRR